MEILRFYKEEGKRWYADIPLWTGRKSALRMVGGADELLDIIAKGRDEVYLHFSETEIERSDILYFKKKTFINGATYGLKQYNGHNYNLKVWLCDVTLHVLGKFPQRIYFKEILDIPMVINIDECYCEHDWQIFEGNSIRPDYCIKCGETKF